MPSDTTAKPPAWCMTACELTAPCPPGTCVKAAVRPTEADIAALRARLAPTTTHADDEALLSAAAYSVHPEDIRRAWSGIARRLAELRARAEKAEVRVHELTVAFDQQDMALDGARGCLDEQTARAEAALQRAAEKVLA